MKLVIYFISKIIIYILLIVDWSSAAESDQDKFVHFTGGGKIEEYIYNRGFYKMLVIYQQNLDEDQDGILDIDEYMNNIRIALEGLNNIIVLDWEGEPYLKITNNVVDSSEVGKIVLNYLEAISILKKHSGFNIDVGYFGFPSKGSTRRESINQETDTLFDLYDSVDVLFPSLYMNKRGISYNSELEFIKKHLQNALKISCGSTKKVYPFITHRWHPKSRYSANQLIPLPIFEEYIKAIKGISYENCYIDGIVWWGADDHWARKGREVIKKSLSNYSTIEDYNTKVISNYANIIEKYF